MKSALVSLLIATTSLAGSATWNLDPASGDWSTATNWTPATVPNGPGDVATFDQSDSTAVTLSKSVKVDSIVFAAGGSAFTISTGLKTLTFSGAGVINNSQLPQNFTVAATPGFIQFINSANAGDATYTQTGESGGSTITYFLENASAGNATFINQGGDFSAGAVLFFGSSTAANGTFFNRAGTANGGATDFFENSNAGNATIICEGGSSEASVQAFCYFNDSSSAADASIVCQSASGASGLGGAAYFTGNSTAGNAHITLQAAPSGAITVLSFLDNSTAGNATVVANGAMGGLGSHIFFNGGDGGTARFLIRHGAILSVSTDHKVVSLGSVEGSGAIWTGSNTIKIGTNNISTRFSGEILERAFASHGAITKVGTGTLELGGPSTYTGVTTVEGGTLLINNLQGSGTGTGPVQVNAGRLGGSGTISGEVSVGQGVPGAFLSPQGGESNIGTLAVGTSLTFHAQATYEVQIDSIERTSDSVTAREVSIESGALISVNDLTNGVLPTGKVFVVITSRSSRSLLGAFANLAEGSILTVGANHFQASYLGGDGNDLTLTVVP